MAPDVSDLADLNYACIDNCALCCLCQPELSGDENRSFMKDPALKAGVTSRTPEGARTKALSLKMKEGLGSCHFLRSRRCSIYDRRPRYCRLFPLQVFLGDRVQIVANLSCRGVSEGGQGRPLAELVPEAEAWAKRLGLEQERAEVGRSYQDLRSEYFDNDPQFAREELAGAAARTLDALGLEGFIGRSLVFSSLEEGGPDVASLPVYFEGLKPPDLVTPAIEGAREYFSGQTAVALPVWTDPALQWTALRIRGEELELCAVGDDGGLKILGRKALAERPLLPFDKEGSQAAMQYARRLIGRDLTYGHAAYLYLLDDGEDAFPKVYFGALGTILLDFWYRASAIAAFAQRTALGPEDVLEGVRAFDMDYLDLPALGGFL
jgi:Fe-S-cluster containining protein